MTRIITPKDRTNPGVRVAMGRKDRIMNDQIPRSVNEEKRIQEEKKHQEDLRKVRLAIEEVPPAEEPARDKLVEQKKQQQEELDASVEKKVQAITRRKNSGTKTK